MTYRVAPPVPGSLSGLYAPGRQHPLFFLCWWVPAIVGIRSKAGGGSWPGLLLSSVLAIGVSWTLLALMHNFWKYPGLRIDDPRLEGGRGNRRGRFEAKVSLDLVDVDAIEVGLDRPRPGKPRHWAIVARARAGGRVEILGGIQRRDEADFVHEQLERHRRLPRASAEMA